MPPFSHLKRGHSDCLPRVGSSMFGKPSVCVCVCVCEALHTNSWLLLSLRKAGIQATLVPGASTPAPSCLPHPFSTLKPPTQIICLLLDFCFSLGRKDKADLHARSLPVEQKWKSGWKQLQIKTCHFWWVYCLVSWWLRSAPFGEVSVRESGCVPCVVSSPLSLWDLPGAIYSFDKDLQRP